MRGNLYSQQKKSTHQHKQTKKQKNKKHIHRKSNSALMFCGVVYHNVFIRPVEFLPTLFESVKGVIASIMDLLVLLLFLSLTLSSSTTGHQNKHPQKTGAHAEDTVALNCFLGSEFL